MQLGEHNVRVNNILPGAIPTGIFGKAFGLEADRADTAAGLLWQRSQKRNRFRAGSPDDIAEAAVFLASDHSSFSGLSAGRLWAVQRQSLHAMARGFWGQAQSERWPTVIRMSLRYDTVTCLGQPSKKLITRGL